MVHSMGIDLRHIDGGCSRGERRLGERVDLRPVEVIAEERVLVGRQVDAVRIRPKMRIVAEAGIGIGGQGELSVGRNPPAAMVGSAVGAVVLDGDTVDGPVTEGARALADRDVQMVGAFEVAASNMVRGVTRSIDVDRQDVGIPPLARLVEEAAGVGHEGAERARRPDDLGWTNVWRSVTPFNEFPDASYTFITSLMISITAPLPAHRPWSGGSSEN